MDLSNKPNYMFSQPALDYFFRWHWWVAQVFFLPIVLVSLTLGFMMMNISLATAATTFCFGFFFWTFFEYLMHRFMFHIFSGIPKLEHLHYVVHGMHHVYPTDPKRVIFPPFGSLLMGALLVGLMAFIVPLPWLCGGAAGFIAGYCWYEFVHYASHHVKWRVGWLKRLKRHHLLHHHNEAFKDKNYGVTTVLWDRVFSTYLA